MADSKHDNNGISTMTGLLNSNGSTITLIKADPTTHGIDTDDNTTGSDLTGDYASHDNNRVTTLLAVSELDGITPVPLYVDSDGKLLVDSN